MSCSDNNLTSLGINGAYRLSELGCDNNALTYLDLNSSNLTYLSCSNNNLTSIENIGSNRELSIFNCSNNNIASLDLSLNYALNDLNCSNNNLSSLNVKSGYNDRNLNGFNALNNPDLICIQVDDVAYSNANWPDKDAAATYSEICLPSRTSLLDDAFEQALIDLGFDDVLDGYVLTTNISSITELNVNGKGISDLTGIEGFSALETLYCKNNNLTALDLSLNIALKTLDCSNNNLEILNLKNGNNINFVYLNTTGNPDLACIQVDEIDYCNIHWNNNTNKNRHFCIDDTTTFSENCSALSVKEVKDNSYQIYPNPVIDVLNIELSQGIELKQVNIYNALSQYLYSVKTSKIDAKDLSSGLYFIELKTNKGKSVQKIVVK